MGSRGVIVAAVAALACACGSAPRGARSARPNVVLVTIDTWRADRLNPSAAPNLDALASRGVRFTAARSAVPLTLPSHATILTGLLPPAHGVRENGLDRLADSHPTIATLFKSNGYRTGAFVGAFVLDRRFGLARGFDVYDDRIVRDPKSPDRLEAERPASAVVDAALAWVDSAPSTQHQAPAPGTQHLAPGTRTPFFIWIHLYDPHAPYTAPPAFARGAKSPYDAEVMYADAELARVWHWLEAEHLDGSTIIVVAGDHGEGLGDHGERTHGMLLYDSTLRVPLIVSIPGRRAATRTDGVSLADISPTILRAAGIAPPADVQGRDLFDERAERTLYSQTDYPAVAGWSALRALSDGRWKAISAYSGTELYDLPADAAEQRNVAAAQSATARALESKIAAIGSRTTAPVRQVSAETEQRLRALGYVAGSAQPAAVGRAPNPAGKIAEWNAFEEALDAANRGSADRLDRLRRIAAADPESPLFATTLARETRDTGDVRRALALYRDAARRWPTDARLLHDLGVTAAMLADRLSDHAGSLMRSAGAEEAALRGEAARAEEAAIAIEPSYAAAHNALGLLDAGQGRDPDALSSFARATELDPTNASYWTNLGNAKRSAGDDAGAEAAFTRALQLDDHQSDAANGLGALLVSRGRAADAIRWFERALAADPSSVDARLNLGIAYQETGDGPRAAEQYRLVLKAPAQFRQQRAAAAKLLASTGAGR